MTVKLLMVFSTLILFTSCELLQPYPSPEPAVEVINKQPTCIWEIPSQGNECNIDYWLKFWYEIEDISWPERKKLISPLSEQETDILKNVLLSQGQNTPFQDRLRAQVWVESILPKLSQHMRRFISVALYHPSQSLLEMESALVTLSQINTHQLSSIEEQKTVLNEQKTLLNEQEILLNKQQNQIDQLLNIEASIMQVSEEDKE